MRVAARRARMLLDGSSFARETDGLITVPDAEVEIDLDIESSADGRIYLWGFLVQHAAAPGGVYHEFSRFDDLDDAAEAALAVDAFTWLRSMIDASASVAVYHYSGYETAKIKALADREQDAVLDWAAEYAEEQFVDLLEIVKAHFFGVSGLGLKMIAKHAGLQLARRRSRRAQFPVVVRRGGPRRHTRSPGAGSDPGTGIQRGRRQRHQPAQSVAASAVIAASSERRWLRSMTASTNSMPTGGSAAPRPVPRSSPPGDRRLRWPRPGWRTGCGAACRRSARTRADGRAARAPGWRRCCRRRRWRPRSADRATARRAR